MVAHERALETVFNRETKRLFTKWSLTGGGRLREVVAMRELTVFYFNSFYGLRFMVDFDPFWFLFPIHIVGVPLLLLYIKKSVSQGN